MEDPIEKKDSIGLDYLRRNIREILRLEQSQYAGKMISEIGRFVSFHCADLKTHQIRNIFGRIKRADTPGKLQVARNFLTYIAGRQEGRGQEAIKFFNEVLEKVGVPKEDASPEEQKNAQTAVKNVHHFFESIVAFHKFHFGDKSR